MVKKEVNNEVVTEKVSFKDKVKNLANKATDIVKNAKAVYESECVNVECFSLKNISKKCNLKAKIDYKKSTIEFSGVLDVEAKEIENPRFYMDPNFKYFEIVSKTIKQETIVIQLKSKEENHVITTAKIAFKELILK